MTVDTIATQQLRCRSQLHGIVKKYPDGKVLFEVRCKNKLCCPRRSGIIVLHYINVDTGELDHTKKFRDPNTTYRRKVNEQ